VPSRAAARIFCAPESKNPYRQKIMSSSRQHVYFVYIPGSLSGTLHVGVTSSLRFRVRRHHTFQGFTAKYDVDRLLYYEEFGEVSDAIKREKQLKGWRREKKIALIEPLNPQGVDLSRDRYPRAEVMTF
jgi:putative endonuclease